MKTENKAEISIVLFIVQFRCDLSDEGYVGYTRGHLHNLVN